MWPYGAVSLATSHRSETAPHGCLVATFFALFDRVSDFDLLIGGRGIVMDHPCAEFGDIKYFSFSRFYFDRMTEAYQRYYSRNYRIGVSITTIRMTKMNNLLMMVLQ